MVYPRMLGLGGCFRNVSPHRIDGDFPLEGLGAIGFEPFDPDKLTLAKPIRPSVQIASEQLDPAAR